MADAFLNTKRADHIEIGILAEEKVKLFFEKQKYKLNYQRLKTPYAEVDLVMSNANETLLIEVKSLGKNGFVRFRVGQNQKQRLLRAFEWYSARTNKEVRLLLAIVEATGEIQVFEDWI